MKRIFGVSLFAVLVSCGQNSDVRLSSEKLRTKDPGSRIYSSLELNASSDIFCAPGFSFNSVSRFCESGEHAAGPFTAAMTKQCMTWGGGESCNFGRWNVKMARSARGTGVCPLGSTMDKTMEVCAEGSDVFGPFTRQQVDNCKKLSPDDTAVCESNRWHISFVAPVKDPVKDPVPPPAQCTTLKDHQRIALEIIGRFETGGDGFSALSGNFDGQGISFGVMQWNFGQGSLQPLLRDVIAAARKDVENIFGPRFATLVELSQSSAGTAMAITRAELLSGTAVRSEWANAFKNLGKLTAMQNVEIKFANTILGGAVNEMKELGFNEARSYMAIAQNNVQNGFTYDPRPGADSAISGAYREWLKSNTSKTEKEKIKKLMLLLVTFLDNKNSPWADDVFDRNLSIINGTGIVHGQFFDYEKDFKFKLNTNIFADCKP